MKVFYVIFYGKYWWFLFFLGIPLTMNGHSDDNISPSLLKAGFENVRVRKENSSTYISFENSIYRWNVKGVIVALDSVAALLLPTDTVHFVLLSMGIPQIVIETKISDWTGFRNGTLPVSEYEQLLSVSYDTGSIWKKLRDDSSDNASYGKLDLVLYTQIKVANYYYNRLLDTQINFAPTLELSLWKGAKGTLQWLFPLTNAAPVFGKEGRFVRPGFVTFNQQFQIHPRIYTDFSVGLFNNDRSGIDWEAIYHLNRWISLRTEAAYTGSVNLGDYLPSDWKFTTWDRFTWSAGGSYFNRRYSVQASAAVQQFLAGDVGIRMDITRFFGEVAIGFYALVSDGDKNAGFHFAIPLPGSRRPRWKNRFRVMLPEYFDWEYSVAKKTESGSSFEVRPNENRVEHLFNPVYIKSQLLTN